MLCGCCEDAVLFFVSVEDMFRACDACPFVFPGWLVGWLVGEWGHPRAPGNRVPLRVSCLQKLPRRTIDKTGRPSIANHKGGEKYLPDSSVLRI